MNLVRQRIAAGHTVAAVARDLKTSRQTIMRARDALEARGKSCGLSIGGGLYLASWSDPGTAMRPDGGLIYLTAED